MIELSSASSEVRPGQSPRLPLPRQRLASRGKEDQYTLQLRQFRRLSNLSFKGAGAA